MATTNPCQCWACRNCTCETLGHCYPCMIVPAGEHPEKDPT